MDQVKEIFEMIKDEDLMEDRREYDVDDLKSAYELTDDQAQALYDLIQNEEE